MHLITISTSFTLGFMRGLRKNPCSQMVQSELFTWLFLHWCCLSLLQWHGTETTESFRKAWNCTDFMIFVSEICHADQGLVSQRKKEPLLMAVRNEINSCKNVQYDLSLSGLGNMIFVITDWLLGNAVVLSVFKVLSSYDLCLDTYVSFQTGSTTLLSAEPVWNSMPELTVSMLSPVHCKRQNCFGTVW